VAVSCNKFGVLLKQIRLAAGWSQPHLAKAAALEIHYPMQLESGAKPHPRVETVDSLARALGVSGLEADQLRAAAGYVPVTVEKGEWSNAQYQLSRFLADPRIEGGLKLQILQRIEVMLGDCQPCESWGGYARDIPPRPQAKKLILQELALGDFTRQQLEVRTTLFQSTVNRTLTELMRAGKVVKNNTTHRWSLADQHGQTCEK
jgi:transcriptional regulator with XRE-family HTH domain